MRDMLRYPPGHRYSRGLRPSTAVHREIMSTYSNWASKQRTFELRTGQVPQETSELTLWVIHHCHMMCIFVATTCRYAYLLTDTTPTSQN
ncbi:hypothetical protein FRB94_006841 [Tulasnella sp. JGI-2019a]|nr:hypothetical protein FRB94_006841 [Tulasnella sp. JGI-2019a]